MEKFFDPAENIEISKLRHDIDELFKNLSDSDCVKVPLTKHLYAVVDRYFLDEILKHNWMTQATVSGVYAAANINGERYYLQRFIMELLLNFRNPKKKKTAKHVTFKNKLSLDCRVKNLTGVNRQDVMRNRRPKSRASLTKKITSKYRGVCKASADTRFKVSISGDYGVVYFLGRHKDELFAARVWDAAAKELWRETKYLNFPNENDEEAREVSLNYINNRKIRLSQIPAVTTTEVTNLSS